MINQKIGPGSNFDSSTTNEVAVMPFNTDTPSTKTEKRALTEEMEEEEVDATNTVEEAD
jgi:hypothetical protein